MRITTYNLRYDSIPDNISVQQSLASLPDPLVQPHYLAKSGEQPWSARRLKVAEHLLHAGVVMASGSYSSSVPHHLSNSIQFFLGFQEALVRQVNDLAQLLGDDWAWVRVDCGRVDE